MVRLQLPIGMKRRKIAVMREKPAQRALKRPDTVRAPANWKNPPVPAPAPIRLTDDPDGLNPVRYGDWVKNGIAIDF